MNELDFLAKNENWLQKCILGVVENAFFKDFQPDANRDFTRKIYDVLRIFKEWAPKKQEIPSGEIHGKMFRSKTKSFQLAYFFFLT